MTSILGVRHVIRELTSAEHEWLGRVRRNSAGDKQGMFLL